jgi:hypothetical protein
MLSFWPPALDRGDRILGGHRLAIVPLQPVAQGEGIGEVIVTDLVRIDHLGLHVQVLIQREQRVVDQIAVVAADVRRRPDRVDDLEVRVHDRA